MQRSNSNKLTKAIQNLSAIATDSTKSSNERMDAIKTLYYDFGDDGAMNALFEIASRGVTEGERKAAMWRAKSLKGILGSHV